MPLVAMTKANLYRDSVALMRIGERVRALPGVRQATLMMGTPANRELLAQARLLAESAAQAGPGDLIVAIDADSESAAETALREAERLVSSGGTLSIATAAAGASGSLAPRSIAMAAAQMPHAGLVMISVPGPYAGAEALKALKSGRHVVLFSDNVPLSEERAIKSLGARKGLLVMGPDCGTAILNGVPFGFANAVRRGSIGVVGASGTGLQEVTTQIHLLGGGISNAIGTGGRDVTAEVGGITTLQALDLLASDDATRVIAVVCKLPAREVADKILARLAAIGKPAAALFMGTPMEGSSGIEMASTLDEVAAAAVRLAGMAPPPAAERAPIRPPFVASQKFVRGLYSGGTYCSEAQTIWRDLSLASWSNAPIDKTRKLVDSQVSVEHTAIDLGDDEFTLGKFHPLIDLSTRVDRLRQEARDRAVAVIVLDVVLGYGAHPDPAGALAPVIRDARLGAAKEGRSLAVVAFVCGTEEDPQRRSEQVKKLRDAGVLVVSGSSAAAQAAARLVASP